MAAPAKTDSGCCSSVCYSTLILRLALGGMLFFLGLGKFLMGTSAFVTQYSAAFTTTWLPMSVVTGWLSVVPHLEVTLGALLVLGLFTRWAAILTGFFLTIMLFGGAISVQATIFYNVYLPLFAALWLVKKPTSSISLDKVFGCKTC